MSLTLIKPGTKIEFMGRRRLFFAVSALFILAGAAALLISGLNLGVDFKGGTKMVVAFKGEEQLDREVIRAAVIDSFKKLHPGEDVPQVEVQDFYTGGTSGETGVRYMIYTEVVTLLTESQKESIVTALKEKLGDDTTVNPPAEGGDQFFISIGKEGSINQRIAELHEIFKSRGLEQVVVESDKVKDLNLAFYKEANLAKEETGSEESYLAEYEARKAFEKRVANFKESNTDVSFTVKIEELKGKMAQAIKSVPELGGRFAGVESSTSISSSVGSDLLNSGLLAVVYACIGILLYIALRFDFKYGPGAVAALMHDAFITVGIFSITQIPFSLPIIAAVLTIIGYSVNDTIVVFDRIRENVEKLKGLSFERIINVSINETLSRTVLTSLTTLVVVVSIFLLGGGLIKDFAFALIIGILIGTYSSIFVASPILLGIHGLTAKKDKVGA